MFLPMVLGNAHSATNEVVLPTVHIDQLPWMYLAYSCGQLNQILLGPPVHHLCLIQKLMFSVFGNPIVKYQT